MCGLRRSTWSGEELADARAVGDEAALAELAAAHDQQLAVVVDVADAQAAGFAGSQPEPVAEREDGVVGGAAALAPRVVGQGSGGVEQPAGLNDVEDERQALVGLAAGEPAAAARSPGVPGRQPSRGSSRGRRRGG